MKKTSKNKGIQDKCVQRCPICITRPGYDDRYLPEDIAQTLMFPVCLGCLGTGVRRVVNPLEHRFFRFTRSGLLHHALPYEAFLAAQALYTTLLEGYPAWLKRLDELNKRLSVWKRGELLPVEFEQVLLPVLEMGLLVGADADDNSCHHERLLNIAASIYIDRHPAKKAQQVLSMYKRFFKVAIQSSSQDHGFFQKQLNSATKSIFEIERLKGSCIDIERFLGLWMVFRFWDAARRPAHCFAEQLATEFFQAIEQHHWTLPSPEKRALYQPVDLPKKLSGLHAVLLWNAHDAIRVYGQEELPGAFVVRLDWPFSISLGGSQSFQNRRLSFLGSGFSGESFEFGDVLWDSRLTVDDLRAFLVLQDLLHVKEGLFDPATGKRGSDNRSFDPFSN